MTRCSDCPASPCVVKWTGHIPYCHWAKAGGVWRDRVAELSAAGPSDPIVATNIEATDSPFAATEAVALVLAMRRCPYRSTPSSCGCSGSACGLRPADRQVVAIQDCFQCIERYGDA